MAGSITREGDEIVVRIPIDEVQGLRVALQPCRCKAPKSHSTTAIRERLARALGRALFPKRQGGLL